MVAQLKRTDVDAHHDVGECAPPHCVAARDAERPRAQWCCETCSLGDCDEFGRLDRP